MVENVIPAADTQQQEESPPSLRLPAAMLSMVANYLPIQGKVRMSQSSLFFSHALQQHYKLLTALETK